jgi:hypothetical protein
LGAVGAKVVAVEASEIATVGAEVHGAGIGHFLSGLAFFNLMCTISRVRAVGRR